MKIAPFLMERWQSTYEHDVEINLSDSGVHPLTPRELLESAEDQQALLDQRLIYTQTNGTESLRAAVAEALGGEGPDHVLITNGGAEANFLSAWHLIEPGDRVVMMLPNYMQLWELSRSLGAEVVAWHGEPDFEAGRWTWSLDALKELVDDRTKLIVICHPNNPTGYRFDEGEVDSISEIASAHNAWILADEIYRGSELRGPTSPSFYGRLQRVLVTGSLSKTYGLPGLRLGWVLGPKEVCSRLWAMNDYTTISPGALSDHMGTIALREPLRTRLLRRTESHLLENLESVRRWVAKQPGVEFIAPMAGAMVYLHYAQKIDSEELADRLRLEKSLLLVPGSHFGMPGWLRLGLGAEAEALDEGLKRLGALLESVTLDRDFEC